LIIFFPIPRMPAEKQLVELLCGVPQRSDAVPLVGKSAKTQHRQRRGLQEGQRSFACPPAVGDIEYLPAPVMSPSTSQEERRRNRTSVAPSAKDCEATARGRSPGGITALLRRARCKLADPDQAWFKVPEARLGTRRKNGWGDRGTRCGTKTCDLPPVVFH